MLDKLIKELKEQSGVASNIIGTLLFKKVIQVLEEIQSKIGWQPIASAPKDGTKILVTWKETWTGRKFVHIEAVAWSQEGENWYYVYDGDTVCSDPTHWMALPNEPE